jgi:hypothetical protein
MGNRRTPLASPDFVGPVQPSLREVLAWAGVRPRSQDDRESTQRWRRRRAQMRKKD